MGGWVLVNNHPSISQYSKGDLDKLVGGGRKAGKECCKGKRQYSSWDLSEFFCFLPPNLRPNAEAGL